MFCSNLPSASNLPEWLCCKVPLASATLLCVRSPQDLADLVRKVTRDHAPFGYEFDEGEDVEAFMVGVRKAERQRAYDLACDVLEIVGKA